LYTLTTQGVFGCLATSTPTPTPTQTPTGTPASTPASTPTPTSIPLPNYSYLVNGTASVSAAAACLATKNIYLWSYGSTFTDGTTYYEGNSGAPTFPLVVYVGGDRWKSDGSTALQINDSGFATNATTCPTQTPTPDPTQTPTGTPASTPASTPTPTGTPESTPSPSQASSYTINWTNNDITTGTNTLNIYKNSSPIVNQSGLGSGSFSVNSGDVITYDLSSTTPDFTEVQIIDSVYVTISNCGFNSSSVSRTIGVTYSSNATIDGVTTNYISECP
jgi:hypothetical protein